MVEPLGLFVSNANPLTVRMDLVLFLQRRLDALGGSWPDCRETLRILAQLAPTCRLLANTQKARTRELATRFAGTDDFLVLQKSLISFRYMRVFQRSITAPLPRDEFLDCVSKGPGTGTAESALQWQGESGPGGVPHCSVLACGRLLGTRMMVCREGTRWSQVETDVYGCYEEYPYADQMQNLMELYTNLTHVFNMVGECRIYSCRRRRRVNLHYGCFACSAECYWDIVRALQLWEGPDEAQQVVVVTAPWGTWSFHSRT